MITNLYHKFYTFVPNVKLERDFYHDHAYEHDVNDGDHDDNKDHDHEEH